MVAAENGALPGGKVGGMGDVIRDIPKALSELGHQVDVVVPGYQVFSQISGARKKAKLEVRFRRAAHEVDIFEVVLPGPENSVRCWVVEHALLAPEKPGQIYCSDPPGRPFATDASKFAFFCAAVCQLLVSGIVGGYDVIHLHDWHTAILSVLVRFDPRYSQLGRSRLVITIHNLALQGIRPFANDESSLESWFPHLHYNSAEIVDPRYGDCFNPMRAAINICHRVHTVSPTYALEILKPSKPEEGFYGGEGLEKDLSLAHRQGKLVGILNGCEYPRKKDRKKKKLRDFLKIIDRQLKEWIPQERYLASAHYIAQQRLESLTSKNSSSGTIITSVGRLTPQKVLLFQARTTNGKTCIETLLDVLLSTDLFIMLGSGDPEIEEFFTRIAALSENFLFLNGFSETLSEELYSQGELFLMPSSFEPCGISQMLAMRSGQPCLVHGVGGLADTVKDDADGFVFYGNNISQQATGFVHRFSEVLALKDSSPDKWQDISSNASSKRFYWKTSAIQYCSELYS